MSKTSRSARKMPPPPITSTEATSLWHPCPTPSSSSVGREEDREIEGEWTRCFTRQFNTALEDNEGEAGRTERLDRSRVLATVSEVQTSATHMRDGRSPREASRTVVAATAQTRPSTVAPDLPSRVEATMRLSPRSRQNHIRPLPPQPKVNCASGLELEELELDEETPAHESLSIRAAALSSWSHRYAAILSSEGLPTALGITTGAVIGLVVVLVVSLC